MFSISLLTSTQFASEIEYFLSDTHAIHKLDSLFFVSGVPRGELGGSTPPPEIPKAFQSRARLNPIVKTVKNCWI